jgi:hypothetical protein
MSTKIQNINIDNYSERAIVVRGNTEDHKEELTALGGKWNSRLRDGAGWIFPKTKNSMILSWIESGKLPQGVVVRSLAQDSPPQQQIYSSSFSSSSESQMLREIQKLNKKVDNLEKLIKKLILKHDDTKVESSDDEDEEGAKICVGKRLLMV